MSFSLPNFFFHATTVYDILHHKGALLGKRDFMGKMKIEGAKEQPLATPLSSKGGSASNATNSIVSSIVNPAKPPSG